MLKNVLLVAGLLLLVCAVAGTGILFIRTATATSTTDLDSGQSFSLPSPPNELNAVPDEPTRRGVSMGSPAIWSAGALILAVNTGIIVALIAALVSGLVASGRTTQPAASEAVETADEIGRPTNKSSIRWLVTGAAVVLFLFCAGTSLCFLGNALLADNGTVGEPTELSAVESPTSGTVGPSPTPRPPTSGQGDQPTRTPRPPGGWLETTEPLPLSPTLSTQSLLTSTLALPGASPTEASSHTEEPGSSPETVLVATEHPLRLSMHDSGEVRISLIRLEKDDAYTLTVEFSDNVGELMTLEMPEDAIPEAPLPEAFGAEYQGYAVASLAGGGFDITLLNVDSRESLEQSRIDWVWSVKPSGTIGEHTLVARIEGIWERVDGQGTPIERQLWRNRFNIRVTQSLVTVGQLNVISMVGSIAGSGLSIPWAFDKTKSFLERRRKRE